MPASRRYAGPVKHDDVVIVPEFFCKEEDWETYYALIQAQSAAKIGPSGGTCGYPQSGLWEMTTVIQQKGLLKDYPPPYKRGDSQKYHRTGWINPSDPTTVSSIER